MGLQADFENAWNQNPTALRLASTSVAGIINDSIEHYISGPHPSEPSGPANYFSIEALANLINWVDENGYWTSAGTVPGLYVTVTQTTQALAQVAEALIQGVQWLGQTAQSYGAQIDTNTGNIWNLDNVWLPWVQGEIANLQALAGNVTQAELNNAIAYSQYLYNQAVARADADQAAAEQQATAQYNQATSYSQQLYNQAVAHADQDMATAEQQATNQHNQAEQDAQNAANQAQSNAQGYTDGAVRGAEALAAASLALQVASDAAEFATLTAGVAAVADLAGDAIMANGLLQLLEAGALFGFLALAIKEPVGTANVSVGVLDPLLDQAGALVDDVIGFLV
jgi:hypothetical protein